jgi:hypothetical protein
MSYLNQPRLFFPVSFAPTPARSIIRRITIIPTTTSRRTMAMRWEIIFSYIGIPTVRASSLWIVPLPKCVMKMGDSIPDDPLIGQPLKSTNADCVLGAAAVNLENVMLSVGLVLLLAGGSWIVGRRTNHVERKPVYKLI